MRPPPGTHTRGARRPAQRNPAEPTKLATVSRHTAQPTGGPQSKPKRLAAEIYRGERDVPRHALAQLMRQVRAVDAQIRHLDARRAAAGAEEEPGYDDATWDENGI